MRDYSTPVSKTLNSKLVLRLKLVLRFLGAIMRHVIALLGAAVLGISVANAADMPVKAPPMAAPAAYDWTGLYLGINGGYGWGTSNHTNTTSGVTTGNFDINGGVVGGTYGGNWQIGRVVLGFEGDFDWAHINGVGGIGATCGAGCFTNTKWLSTDRARLGWDSNGWLLYATGGVAFAKVDAGLVPCSPCKSNNPSGWTAGVGVEKMFYRNWSAKIEYLHYDLGRRANWPAAGGANTVTVLDRGDIIRAGINYHFNLSGLPH